MTRNFVFFAGRSVVLGAVLIAVAATGLLAQALKPQPAGPSVAGHWTGKINMVLAASKREVSFPVEFQLEQDGNDVTGKLMMTRGNLSISVKGIEENGKLNLLWDFSSDEHCRLHLTIDGDTLKGNLFNFHDNPQKWDSDETGDVALDRAK